MAFTFVIALVMVLNGNLGNIVVPIDREDMVASINNKLLVKRIKYKKDAVTLVSDNQSYPDIPLNSEDDFEIWGVVSSVIKIV